MGEVEFLDTDLDGPQRPPPSRRAGWVLGLVALLVVAMVWTLTRHEPRPTPPPRQSLPTALPTLPIAHPSSSARRDPCHGVVFCTGEFLVPSRVVAAVHKHFPQAKSVLAVSYLGRIGTTGAIYLIERHIEVLAGSRQVYIVLHRDYGTPATPSPIVTAGAGTGSALIHADPPGFVVDLQYLAPEYLPPNASQLKLLARDSDLESL
ncbi:MAG TPA: hypothetical protein VH395_01245 [Jatrophihabitantaceae bacterium]